MIRRPSKPPSIRTGYDDFLRVLQKFRGLSAAALGTAIAVPFAGYLTQILPPWPPGVVFITALVELMSLIMVFQLLRRATKPTIDRSMLLSLVLLAIGSSIYLLFFALFTYPIPAAKTREIAGFVCRTDILAAARDECPFVGSEQLSNAGYIAETFWLPWSINVMCFSPRVKT
jgi:hypothetical protein